MRCLSRTIVGLSKSRAIQPSPKTIRLYDKILDRAYYLSANPDVAGTGIDPLRHFGENGAREGRSPHP